MLHRQTRLVAFLCLTAAAAPSCARTPSLPNGTPRLQNDLRRAVYDGPEFREVRERENRLKKWWYDTAVSGRGTARIEGWYGTKEGDPVVERLVVTDGRAELVRDFSRDKMMPYPRRLSPYRSKIREYQLGYLAPPPGTQPLQTFLHVRPFVPDPNPPADRQWFIRFVLEDGGEGRLF